MKRLISLYTSIDLQRLNAETLENDEREIVDTARYALEERIWIDDSPSPALSQLRTRVQEMMQKGKVDLIIVDYVNLMQSEVIFRLIGNAR